MLATSWLNVDGARLQVSGGSCDVRGASCRVGVHMVGGARTMVQVSHRAVQVRTSALQHSRALLRGSCLLVQVCRMSGAGRMGRGAGKRVSCSCFDTVTLFHRSCGGAGGRGARTPRR